jgi:hypothetical protein
MRASSKCPGAIAVENFVFLASCPLPLPTHYASRLHPLRNKGALKKE